MNRMTTLIFRSAVAACALSSLSVQGQLVLLTDDWGNTVNNTVVSVWVDNNAAPTPEVDLLCNLQASVPTVINVKRYELEFPNEDTTKNYFCWGECYAPAISGTHPLWYALETVELQPNSDFTGFHAYYNAMGLNGPAAFRYVWFDEANPNDSTWADIVFNATPVGISDLAAQEVTFNAYPVPSIGGQVQLTFDAPRTGQQMMVRFHDALGQLVGTESIRTGQQRLTLGEGRLAPGLVFATLVVNGQELATRRLVISGH